LLNNHVTLSPLGLGFAFLDSGINGIVIIYRLIDKNSRFLGYLVYPVNPKEFVII